MICDSSVIGNGDPAGGQPYPATLDVVSLTREIGQYQAGRLGVVVHAYSDGEHFEVEMFSPPAVISVCRGDIASPSASPANVASGKDTGGVTDD